MNGPELERSATEYALAIRMGQRVTPSLERALFDQLEILRADLGTEKLIDRHLTATLVELLVASWAGTAQYEDAERASVESSIAHVGEALMAVLTPSPMPPPPPWQDQQRTLAVQQLLRSDELPVGFAYPKLFIRLVETGSTVLEPWWIIQGAVLRDRHVGLRRRYPSRALVPFAVRQDCDDVACWTADGQQIAIVHDFASPGHEQQVVIDDFAGWLRLAIEDLIAFE